MRNRAEVGRVLLSFGYIDEASQTLREAVLANPQNWTVQYRYLDSLLRQNTAESMQVIRTLFADVERQITDDEQYALFLQQTVQLLRSMQRLAEGVRIVQSTVETSPTARSLWHLAVLHQAEANYPLAVAAVERALEVSGGRKPAGDSPDDSLGASPAGLRPPLLPLSRFAAELYEQSGDTSKAIALYQTLVQSDPARSGNHWQKIITLQIHRGELSQALESTRNLLGRGTENAERLRFVADLFLSVNRRTEAIGLLRQALIHEPGNTDVLRILAQTLADSEQHEEAIELFWRLYDRLDHFSAKLSVIEILAAQYNQLDRDEDLIEHLQQMSRNFDRRREAMQALVRAFMIQGDYDEAQNVLEDLLDMPDDSKTESEFASLWVLRELVSIAERQEDFETAAQYQEILAQKSTDPKEQQYLFHLYDKLGDTERTRKLFFDQILRQGSMEARFEMIDAMIRQGEFDIVSQVLNFLDMHEPEHWGIMFRQILIEAHQNKPIGDLVRQFRTQTKERTGVSPPVLYQGTLSTENRGANATPLVHLPSFPFSGVAPEELTDTLILQDQFLRTVFFPEMRAAHRSPERERLPEGFADVPTLQDARFIVLGWLLREAIVKDITTYSNNPSVMQNFRNTVAELRAMFPADSPNYDVLMERLRLEVWLLDLIKFDAELHELRLQELRVRIEPSRLLRAQLDERACHLTIWLIVRQLALEGVAEWRPALFQILIDECINELVAERFKAVLYSDARLSERLQQILDNLCFELKTPPIPAVMRNVMIEHATRLVKHSTTAHQEVSPQSPETLAQKTDRLLELWTEFVENSNPETREKYQPSFTARRSSRYGTLHWILRSQNRDADVAALEQSLRKTAQNDPLWFVQNIFEFTQPMDENGLLFPTLSFEPLETQFHRVKTSVAEVLPFGMEKGLNRTLSELLFRHFGSFNGLLQSARLQRYDIFTQQELQSVLAFPVQQILEDLRSPTQTQQGRRVRVYVGVERTEPPPAQTLPPDQLARLAELDRSLQQLTDFVFQILDDLNIEPADFASALPTSTIQNVSLTRFRSELQGDRPVDRMVIYSLLQQQATADNFSVVDELFFRIILLRRVMDTKTRNLSARVDDRVVPIRENYAETLGQLIENKRSSTVPSDRTWGDHLSATFGDLLQIGGQTANRPALGSDEELLQIVRQLETADGRRQTAAEQLVLALLYVRLQRFEEAVVMLDSMELSASVDLQMREWIIVDLARKRGRPDTPLMKRGAEAVDRLTNFRLSERDSLNLVSVLRFFNRDDEAQRILDHLSATMSDRRLLVDLLNRLIADGESQKENAAKIARRILTNPAFLQNTRRLTQDVMLMETAVRTLRAQNQVDSVVPVLESRLRSHRDKTDARILLARLYRMINRQDEAKALALELAQNPTAEPERRQMIVSLLVDFGLQRELEAMNRLLLERNNR
ncbi:MAG: tetratricopeptide repeat protein [Planctomycetaceae bacterium]|nr:tetratricopeptide repeat protein [Planctomycetaceae bacterium]